MYNMMIVDDEEIIVEGIAKSIPWKDYNVNVVETAYSGKEALDKIKRNNIDILISDIRMPEFSGLELVRSITNMNKDMVIILISAYQDFEYAKQAIQYGIKSYITKPIKKQILIKEVQEAVELLSSRRNEKEILEKYDKIYKQNIEHLKENLFRSLITGRIKNKINIRHVFEDYNLNLYYQNFGVLIIQDETKLYSQESRSKLEHIRRLRILETLRSIQLEHYRFEILDNHMDEIVVIFSMEEYDNNYEQIYLDMGKKIMCEIKSYTNENVIIGIGNIYPGINDINISYQEALIAISHRNPTKKSQVIYMDEIKYGDVEFDNNYTNIDNALKDVVKHIYSSNQQVLMDALKSIKGTIGQHRPFLFLQQVYCQLLSRIMWLLIKEKIPLNKVFGDTTSIYEELLRLTNLSEIEEWFEYVLKVINGKLVKNTSEKYSEPIVNALKYINHHFCDDISLVEVAEYVKLNPSYFSKLFKKETGMSFIKSLNVMRINKAKELLKNTDDKVYKICEQLGYQSQQYFCNLFKNMVGVTPNEFRHSEI